MDTLHITVNGTENDVSREALSYERIMELAGYPGAREMTCVYYGRTVIDGERYEKHGTLIPGESVKPLEGMHFSVCWTGNA